MAEWAFGGVYEMDVHAHAAHVRRHEEVAVREGALVPIAAGLDD